MNLRETNPPGPPRITVVMPMRNAAPWVEEAARSVLAERGVAIELVVVDDGSTDGSADVVRAIGDRRLRVVPGPQAGVGAALNAGFAAARGAFIARCDADDRYTEGRLAQQLAALEARPDCIAVAGLFATMDERGRRIAVMGDTRRAGPITEELMRGEPSTSLCAWLVRARAVRDAGGCRSYFESAEDLDLQFRLAGLGEVLIEPTVVYEYRLHDASLTHRQADRRRAFFETAATRFARQRLERGSDDLSDGVAPRPPEAGRPGSAAAQSRDQLLGEAWRLLDAGHRGAARRAAWRAWRAGIGRPGCWWSCLALAWRSCLPGRRTETR